MAKIELTQQNGITRLNVTLQNRDTDSFVLEYTGEAFTDATASVYDVYGKIIGSITKGDGITVDNGFLSFVFDKRITGFPNGSYFWDFRILMPDGQERTLIAQSDFVLAITKSLVPPESVSVLTFDGQIISTNDEGLAWLTT